ncbi:hypothetical protein GCM10010440_23780 [Kitasatospora cinereorecta]
MRHGSWPMDPAAESVDLLAPVGPWLVRVRRPRGRRRAIEVYEQGELVDVLTESALARGGLLRGVRQAGGRLRGHQGRVGEGGRAAFAWGRLPESGLPPTVTFLRRGVRRRRCAARVVPVDGRFWFACVDGTFHGVQVTSPCGGSARRRSRRTS